MNRLLSACVALALGLAATGESQGSVMDDRLYRLGEDDPGAAALMPGNNPTKDHFSPANDASKVGLTFYHGQLGLGGPVPIGLAPGSTFAMDFTNVDSRYVAPAALPGVTQNFGMEAYVQVSLGVTEARFFYNGGPGFPFAPLTNGYGLGISGGFYAALVANNPPFSTGIPANPLQPVEMALVNTGGMNFEVYIQDTLVLSFVAPVIPPAAGDVLAIGSFVGNQSPPAFAGVVDEARVFTFAPGGFDPSTDLSPAAAAVSVPEPGSFGLLVWGAVGLLGYGWCRRKRA